MMICVNSLHGLGVLSFALVSRPPPSTYTGELMSPLGMPLVVYIFRAEIAKILRDSLCHLSSVDGLGNSL